MVLDKTNLEELNKMNVKGIEFIFDNCESILVPIECFKNFIAINGEVKFKIVNNGNVEYSYTWGDNITNPIERISHKDISGIFLEFEEEEKNNKIQINFNYSMGRYNEYQLNNMFDYKTIEVLISKKAYYINYLQQLKEEKESVEKEIKEVENILKEV